MAKKYKPFSTGTQWADWNQRNCGSCKKGYVSIRSEFRCNLERDLVVAYCSDGQISEKAAKAIGYLDNKDCYTWECLAWVRR